ncbi:MAG: efflux RND transporter periplasmic adaptor subunit [Alphaproteobacteria bacterium]|nr:efflux RND transporter periplasmic adaptor subunit [Alphaproteobacteria bacterium]
MKKGFAWVIIAVLGFLIFYGVRIKQKENMPTTALAQKQTESIVTVQKMQSVPIVLSHAYIGSIIPIHLVEIRPFIAGFIDEVHIKGGDFVNANQPLFSLEQAQYIAQMDLQMSNIMNSSANFENAKIYYERLQKAGDKAVSQSDLDSAKSKFLMTNAALGAAVAEYDAAKVMYNYTFVNAPISGVLGNVTITKGQYVSPESAPLAYLVQTTPMRVVFSIPYTTYLQEKMTNPDALFADKKIRLKLADGRFYDMTGKVQFWDNTVSSTTSSVQVFADFEKKDRMLLPNAYVDVLIEENIPNALVIAQKFVTMKPEGYFVWTVGTDGHLHEKQIEVSEQLIDKSFYFVTNGLQEGDFVVTGKTTQTDDKNPVQMKIEPTQLPALKGENK